MLVKCPTCSRMVEWSESNPHRPFCNERCKLIDLGAWFSEDHRVPGEAMAPPDDEENPQP
jgi:endogenous inhibitor of DNA gyrase (YacG/DUF329 family)